MNRDSDDHLSMAELPSRIAPALTLLLEAVEYARQTSGDPWEFAIEIDQLTALGLTRNDFRCLVRLGLVEHQREITFEGDNGRAFRRTGDLTFFDDTCFVLTDAGISVASEWRYIASDGLETTLSVPNYIWPDGNGSSQPRAERATGPTVPRWDRENRELRVHKTVVKRFKWVAVNQETILAAFEEEGWPVRIDDPLPPVPQQDPKRRLSDTIKCLNRKQLNPLVHFRGDGTGQGVVWEFVKPT